MDYPKRESTARGGGSYANAKCNVLVIVN
jgi:hypothetical protein